MNRFDRALAILLLLQGGTILSAAELARRLEVSKRTIYRDIDTLAAVGVPVYAEPGREGGFRLMEGYFVPPVAFSVGEATSLLIGLVLLDRLRVKPFANELETAQRKLLAAVPEHLQTVLAKARELIKFEALPKDVFHPEQELPNENTPLNELAESQVITVFLQSLFEGRVVTLDYVSPYGQRPTSLQQAPCGLVWDRDHWYLVANRLDHEEAPRFWRADRVQAIAANSQPMPQLPELDLDPLLGRQWLTQAMRQWANLSPVRIRLTAAQAGRLQQDWYYSHAQFKEVPGGQVDIAFGESNQAFVCELLRWLGPGAELLEPEGWRAEFEQELKMMLGQYEAQLQ